MLIHKRLWHGTPFKYKAWVMTFNSKLIFYSAAPGSTGGGIRITTLAVATLNIINTGRNRNSD